MSTKEGRELLPRRGAIEGIIQWETMRDEKSGDERMYIIAQRELPELQYPFETWHDDILTVGQGLTIIGKYINYFRAPISDYTKEEVPFIPADGMLEWADGTIRLGWSFDRSPGAVEDRVTFLNQYAEQMGPPRFLGDALKTIAGDLSLLDVKVVDLTPKNGFKRGGWIDKLPLEYSLLFKKVMKEETVRREREEEGQVDEKKSENKDVGK